MMFAGLDAWAIVLIGDGAIEWTRMEMRMNAREQLDALASEIGCQANQKSGVAPVGARSGRHHRVAARALSPSFFRGLRVEISRHTPFPHPFSSHPLSISHYLTPILDLGT